VNRLLKYYLLKHILIFTILLASSDFIMAQSDDLLDLLPIKIADELKQRGIIQILTYSKNTNENIKFVKTGNEILYSEYFIKIVKIVDGKPVENIIKVKDFLENSSKCGVKLSEIVLYSDPLDRVYYNGELMPPSKKPFWSEPIPPPEPPSLETLLKREARRFAVNVNEMQAKSAKKDLFSILTPEEKFHLNKYGITGLEGGTTTNTGIVTKYYKTVDGTYGAFAGNGSMARIDDFRIIVTINGSKLKYSLRDFIHRLSDISDPNIKNFIKKIFGKAVVIGGHTGEEAIMSEDINFLDYVNRSKKPRSIGAAETPRSIVIEGLSDKEKVEYIFDLENANRATQFKNGCNAEINLINTGKPNGTFKNVISMLSKTRLAKAFGYGMIGLETAITTHQAHETMKANSQKLLDKGAPDIVVAATEKLGTGYLIAGYTISNTMLTIASVPFGLAWHKDFSPERNSRVIEGAPGYLNIWELIFSKESKNYEFEPTEFFDGSKYQDQIPSSDQFEYLNFLKKQNSLSKTNSGIEIFTNIKVKQCDF
jgi:hypothetical protein